MNVDCIEYQNLHMLMYAICYYYHTKLIYYYGPQGHLYNCFPMGSIYVYIIINLFVSPGVGLEIL